jgi:hypothetical protein
MLWTGTFTRYFVARSVSVFGDTLLTVAAAPAISQVYGATGVGLVLASCALSLHIDRRHHHRPVASERRVGPPPWQFGMMVTVTDTPAKGPPATRGQ